MMNNYIISKLTRQYDRSDNLINMYYPVKLVFNIFDKDYEIDGKIDTGCSFSSIPFKKIVKNKSVIEDIKTKCIDNNFKTTISFGVNDSKEYKHEIKKYYKNGEYDKCGNALSFITPDINITLNTCNVKHSIKLNFNRDGNMLIGLDVLNIFDWHEGFSRIYNENVRIGVLRNVDEDDEYVKLLYEHLGIADFSKIKCLSLDEGLIKLSKIINTPINVRFKEV